MTHYRPRYCATIVALSVISTPALPPTGSVTLAWDYPTHGTNITFNIYGSTTLNPAYWTLLTNTPLQQVTIPILKHAQFFAATALDSTNAWLESDFSNAVGLPDPPPSGTNFRVSTLK